METPGTVAKLRKALAVRRTAGQQLERDERNRKLQSEVYRASKDVWRVRTAAKDRFLERYIDELK